MFPLRSAVNCPVLLALVANVCLFDADGFFPPPLTHSYVIDSVALQVTVSTEPDSSPASLNWQTRLDPLSDADVAFLMKCAFPANAEGAAMAATANAPATAAVIFLIPMKILLPRERKYREAVFHAAHRFPSSPRTYPGQGGSVKCCEDGRDRMPELVSDRSGASG